MLQEATPMGSSTSSNRGGSTPFFTSPKASSLTPAQSGTTPFASLSETPFTESEGPYTVETSSQNQPQSHAHTQPLPPPASQQKQAQMNMDNQVKPPSHCTVTRFVADHISSCIAFWACQPAAIHALIDLAVADRPDGNVAKVWFSF